MQEKMGSHDEPLGAQSRVDRAQVEGIIENWPPAPKKVAQDILGRYGLPNEATPTLLIWHNNGPWKRTVITRDEIQRRPITEITAPQAPAKHHR